MPTRFAPVLVVVLVLVAWDGMATPTFGAADPPGSADADPEHEAGGGTPLSFKEDLAIWTAVVFLVLLLILWKFAWGPLARGLEKREHGIAEQIAQAEQSNMQAKRLLAQYEQKLADSQEDVRGILEQARRNSEQLGREMLEKAKHEAKAEQQRAVEQIDAATANALKELAEQSSTLAVELAGRILRAELKPEDHAQLIQQAVSNFAQQEPRSHGASTN
jgi:F-type H+-transporting ATPase subunit b